MEEGRRKANSCYDDTDSCSRTVIDMSDVVAKKMDEVQLRAPVIKVNRSTLYALITIMPKSIEILKQSAESTIISII